MKLRANISHSLLLLLTLGPACSLAPAIPPDVMRDLAAVPVTNRGAFTGSWANESFDIGPYRLSNVERKANITTGLNVAGHVDSGYRSDTASGGYSYAFQTPSGPARGECSAALGDQRLQVAGYGNNSNDGRMGCRCSGPGVNAQVVLAGPGAAWTGQANLHGWPAAMRTVDKYTNGIYSDLPLAIDARAPDQRVLAAVELKRPGKLWFSPGLDAQTHAELACLFAGYLLFENPKQKI